ncbi:MAG: sugar nucleotide-binding protein [Candidatus Pacebacteria bacterium]|nr:sugar nucleotide-binding protein [Candidatus Paceibacterota bacterium]
MNSILGTGLSGLVGSRVVDLLGKTYTFQNLDLTTSVDITNEDQVLRAFESSDAPAVIHMAAFTNATKAWEDRGNKDGVCYKVNVVGTENIAKAAQKTGKQMIHVSTAFVFDGEKDGMYTEEDTVHPVEWYGETKALAEEAVQNMCDNWVIFRIDQPFRGDVYEKKADTTHKLITGIKNRTLYPQFTDHWFSPTIIEDFAGVLDWAIQTHASGIYHATSGIKVSDYDYACMINDALHLGGDITQGSLTEYLKTTQRPYQRNTAMNSKKLQETANIAFTPLEQAIAQIQ